MSLPKTLLDDFERFWAAYPSRPENPKAAAREVFARRVREGVAAELIVGAAGRYAAYIATARKDAVFIPHARTWLSQRRFEDFPESAPAVAATEPPHPLDWLKDEIGHDKWASWIKPLAVADGEPVVITGPRQIGLDHVRAHWGHLIAAHFQGPIAYVREAGRG